MSRNYHPIAFTESVLDAQVRYGSRTAIGRADRHFTGPDSASADTVAEQGSPRGTGGDGTEALRTVRDPLGRAEREFVGERDGFYLATVSESGWPYVQFRGGPPGFVTSPDEHTVAWADFRGNRQYISTGNVAHDPRVAMIFLDYAHQVRLKIFGIARISDPQQGEPQPGASTEQGYRAIVERDVRVEVTAFDWNCPQHITPRYTADELGPVLEPLRRRVNDLERENERLRVQATSPSPNPEASSGPSEIRKDNK